MSAANLSDRLREAHRNFANLQQRVQKTAVDAHRDVTHLLELALTSLLKVVTTVHARYTEGGELDDDGKKMLSKMKESFDTVETAAKTCSNDLGKLHEGVCVDSPRCSYKAALTHALHRLKLSKVQPYHP